MSEVKRYHVTEAGLVEGQALGRINVVLGADHDRVTAERDALQQRLTAADERADRLEQALRFYADGDHLLLADPDAWDTCSGEPVNFLHDDAGTASVEDGSIAKAALKPAQGSCDEYRKSCEAAHKALSMENQRIVAPGQFKCLACGDIHPGSGNLPCPKISPTA